MPLRWVSAGPEPIAVSGSVPAGGGAVVAVSTTSCGGVTLSRLPKASVLVAPVVTATFTVAFPGTSGVTSISATLPARKLPEVPIVAVPGAGELRHVMVDSAQLPDTPRATIGTVDDVLAGRRSTARTTLPSSPLTLKRR